MEAPAEIEPGTLLSIRLIDPANDQVLSERLVAASEYLTSFSADGPHDACVEIYAVDLAGNASAAKRSCAPAECFIEAGELPEGSPCEAP